VLLDVGFVVLGVVEVVTDGLVVDGPVGRRAVERLVRWSIASRTLAEGGLARMARVLGVSHADIVNH